MKSIRVISMDEVVAVKGVINDIYEVEIGYRKNKDLDGKTQQVIKHAIEQLKKGNFVFLEGVKEE